MKRCVFLSFLFAICVAMTLLGQQNENIDLIGRWGNGPCRGVFFYGSYLFMGNGAYLEVVELQGTRPDLLKKGKILLPGVVNDLHVSWPRVYVACEKGGLQIVDVSDPAHPYVQGDYGSVERANGVFVLDYYAYVADGDGRLVIVNIASPSFPWEVGVFPVSGVVWDVWVDDDTAYVAADTSGFWTIDVSDRSTPVLMDSIHTSGAVKGVYIQGGIVYLADGNGGLKTVDISDASALTISDTWAPGVGVDVTDVYVLTSTAYVTDALFGVRVLDVTAVPVEVSSVGTRGSPRAIALSAASTAFVADGGGGMVVLDVATQTPSKIDSVATGDVATDVVIDGDLVYVAGGESGLWILDRSTTYGDTTRTLVHLNTLFPCRGLALRDTLLFVAADTSGLKILNVTDPSSPIQLSSVGVTDAALDVDVGGDSVLVADGSAGVHLFDVSDPANPIDRGVISFAPHGVRRVAVDPIRRLAYVSTDGDGVHILDGTTGNDVGSCLGYTDVYGVGIGEGDTMLFVAGGVDGFIAFDVADSTNPQMLFGYDTDGTAYDVLTVGNAAIVADGQGTVRMIDFSGTPVEVGYYHTAGSSLGLDIRNDTLAVADGAAGVYFLRPNLAGRLVSLRDSLDFGDVVVSKSRGLHLGILNVGTSPVEITNITSGSSRFTTDTSLPFWVTPGDTTGFEVVFEPTIQQTVVDTLVIESDASNSPLRIPVEGTGTPFTPPAAYTPDYFTYLLYDMDSLDGDTLRDASRYGYMDGVVSGAVLSGPDSGRFGRALVFADETDMVTVLSDSMAFLPEWDGFSVDAWFRLTGRPGGRGILSGWRRAPRCCSNWPWMIRWMESGGSWPERCLRSTIRSIWPRTRRSAWR